VRHERAGLANPWRVSARHGQKRPVEGSLCRVSDLPEKRTDPAARRQLKTRNSRAAHFAARWLAAHRVRPDWISVFSIVSGLVGANGFLLAGVWSDGSTAKVTTGLVLAMVGMQLRLACNLLDGMVAVEYNQKSPHGELLNDIPDRITDCLFFIAAGFAADVTFGPILGYSAALLAVMTAYVRTLGKAIGANWHFTGPMAKQHRMALMTLACAVAIVAGFWNHHRDVLGVALCVVIVASVWTIVNRLRKITKDLYTK